MRTSRYFKIVAMTIVVVLLFVGLVITRPLESQGTLPFLSPPYFGQANVSAIFDHEFPVYCGWYPTPPPAPTPTVTPDPYYCKELRYVCDLKDV